MGIAEHPRDERPVAFAREGMALDLGGWEDYVHGLVTTLKTALIHPIIQSLPFSLATSLKFFRNIHGALGLVNINFADTRRTENRLTLETPADGGWDIERLSP